MQTRQIRRAVIRPLENPAGLAAWARSEGFHDLRPEFWHVTVIIDVGCLLTLDPDGFQIGPSGDRKVQRMGGLTVLCFPSSALAARHRVHRKAGGVWEFPTYMPHVSFTPDDGRSLRDVRPFDGTLIFGPEVLG